MPCWKITSGQPLAGLTRPDAALGTVISTGTRTVPVATGRVLRKVRNVVGLLGPSAPAHSVTPTPETAPRAAKRRDEQTSELQQLMRHPSGVFCLQQQH